MDLVCESRFGSRNSGRTTAMLEAAIEASRERPVWVIGRDHHSAESLFEMAHKILDADGVPHSFSRTNLAIYLDPNVGSRIHFGSMHMELPCGARIHWRDVFIDHAVHPYSF